MNTTAEDRASTINTCMRISGFLNTIASVTFFTLPVRFPRVPFIPADVRTQMYTRYLVGTCMHESYYDGGGDNINTVPFSVHVSVIGGRYAYVRTVYT